MPASPGAGNPETLSGFERSEEKGFVRFGNAVGIHFVPENHIVAVMRLGRNPDHAMGSERCQEAKT